MPSLASLVEVASAYIAPVVYYWLTVVPCAKKRFGTKIYLLLTTTCYCLEMLSLIMHRQVLTPTHPKKYLGHCDSVNDDVENANALMSFI